MKEELLWGLLSFQCFLAAPISLASSWIIPEILAALVSRILWTTGSQLKNKILFSFQMSFCLLLAKEGLLFPPLPLYFLIHPYTSQSLASLVPSLHKLFSTGCLSSQAQAACLLHQGTNSFGILRCYCHIHHTNAHGCRNATSLI